MITTQDDESGSLATRLTHLLDRQQGLLAQLDDLSRRQMGLIENDEADRLLALLSLRQELVDDLLETGERLEPLRAEWNAGADRLPPPQRDAVRARIDAVAKLMDQIGARDDEARRRLIARRDQLASELAHVERGRGALAAYGSGDRHGGPAFQDREA